MSKNGWYLELKAAHKCTQCRGRDERTLAGRVLCATCNEKFKGYRERPEYKYAHQNRNNARYWKLQRQRKCTQCGKPLAWGEYYVRCAECRIKQSKRQKEKRQKKKTAESGDSQTA